MDQSAGESEPEPIFYGTCSKLSLNFDLDVVAAVKRVKEEVKNNPKRLTSQDLIQTPPVSEGEVDRVIITRVKDPSEFYVIFERKAKCLEHQEWRRRAFPDFKTGSEALTGITKLLEIYSEVLPSEFRFGGVARSFKKGELVAVKFLKKVKNGGSGRGSCVCQVRRGIIKDVIRRSESTKPVYKCYLIDFGLSVVVSQELLIPLPEPFNFLAPLAIKACLYGVSPVGEQWDRESIKFFKDMLLDHRESILSAEVLSRPNILPEDYPIIINLESRCSKTHPINKNLTKLVFQSNFADVLSRANVGIPWNLFPARPQLMQIDRHDQDASEGYSVNLKAYSMREGQLLTPFHPRAADILPKTVLEREIKKLFRIRREHLVDICGFDNRLFFVLPVEDPELLQTYKTPCTILKSIEDSSSERRERGEPNMQPNAIGERAMH